MSSKDENEIDNDNVKTLMSSKDDNDNENQNQDQNQNEKDDNERMNQNSNNMIKQLIDSFDEITDKSKSFEK